MEIEIVYSLFSVKFLFLKFIVKIFGVLVCKKLEGLWKEMFRSFEKLLI